MRFGDLPAWAAELSDSIHKVLLSSDCVSDPMELRSTHDEKDNISPFPSDLLSREPLFDQLILNSYQPGEVRADSYLFYSDVWHEKKSESRRLRYVFMFSVILFPLITLNHLCDHRICSLDILL